MFRYLLLLLFVQSLWASTDTRSIEFEMSNPCGGDPTTWQVDATFSHLESNNLDTTLAYAGEPLSVLDVGQSKGLRLQATLVDKGIVYSEHYNIRCEYDLHTYCEDSQVYLDISSRAQLDGSTADGMRLLGDVESAEMVCTPSMIKQHNSEPIQLEMSFKTRV